MPPSTTYTRCNEALNKILEMNLRVANSQDIPETQNLRFKAQRYSFYVGAASVSSRYIEMAIANRQVRRSAHETTYE